MEATERLIEKIIETIQRDVNQIFIRTSNGVLAPEHQEALSRYLKQLSDYKLSAKEKELEEKIKRAEEALSRGQAPDTGVKAS